MVNSGSDSPITLMNSIRGPGMPKILRMLMDGVMIMKILSIKKDSLSKSLSKRKFNR